LQPNAKLKNLFGGGVEENQNEDEDFEDFEGGSLLDLSESELEQQKQSSVFHDDRPFANVYSDKTTLEYVHRIRHQ
jgi:hypothetical protein